MATMYKLIESCTEIEDIIYTTYGIEAISMNGIVIATIPNITVNRRDAEQFVNLCNTLELSPEHLYDAVDDFISALI